MEEHYRRSKSKGIGLVTSKVSHRFVKKGQYGEAGDNVMESSVQVSKYSKWKINKGTIWSFSVVMKDFKKKLYLYKTVFMKKDHIF